MISFYNDYRMFQNAGFSELIGCITIAEAQTAAAKSLAAVARNEAEVAMQEAFILREVSTTIAATIWKTFAEKAVSRGE